MPHKGIWEIIAIAEHKDGSRTLTMRNRDSGNIKTENYPAGSTLTITRKADQ